MRLLILSDLHLEIWKQYAPEIDTSISRPDVVILAGDISTGAEGVRWAAEKFVGTPVLYVAGNHEFYRHKVQPMQLEIAAACDASGNVIFFNGATCEIAGVRFVGCTLWTDFALFGDETRRDAMLFARHAISDYYVIKTEFRSGFRRLRPVDTARWHAEQRLWLRQQLDEEHGGKTVVVTHMAPSRKSVVARFAADKFSAAFASNLDDMVERADLWVHGHMHDSLDYTIGHCRVVCNPLGYMTRGGARENQCFDENFVVEI
ncbi:MAG: metallophosphoesterase [Herminiimonas sp.]|nr:metallophosphoesterase [Herminiimonas sp.]